MSVSSISDFPQICQLLDQLLPYGNTQPPFQNGNVVNFFRPQIRSFMFSKPERYPISTRPSEKLTHFHFRVPNKLPPQTFCEEIYIHPIWNILGEPISSSLLQRRCQKVGGKLYCCNITSMKGRTISAQQSTTTCTGGTKKFQPKTNLIFSDVIL